MDVKKKKNTNNNNSSNSNNQDSWIDGTKDKANVLPTVQILFQNLKGIPDTIYFAKTFPKKVFIILSILQIVSSAMAFNSHIFIIISTTRDFRELGTGIWCGFVFGLSGGFGCLAAHKPSARKIAAFLVTSVVSVGFCIPLAVLSTFEVIEDRYLQHTYGKEVKIACNIIQVNCERTLFGVRS
jgi:hypothetical protein